jgi:putative DNA primase/helicase
MHRKPRRVLLVDGEMVLCDLQARLKQILAGLGTTIPNEGFRVLAVDHTERSIDLSSGEANKNWNGILMGSRRPADYAREEGARFEVHIEKARTLTGEGALPAARYLLAVHRAAERAASHGFF